MLRLNHRYFGGGEREACVYASVNISIKRIQHAKRCMDKFTQNMLTQDLE